MGGGSLYDVLHGGGDAKPWSWRLRAALDIAEGVEAIHAASLVHRDLKVRVILNVLFEQPGCL